MRIETVAGMLVSMLLVTTPALAGGYTVINTAFIHALTGEDEYLKSLFINQRFISGTGPSTVWNESLSSNILTELTDFNANFTDKNAYFTRTLGTYALQAGEIEGVPSNKSVIVDAYIIMPGKFDAIQNIDMNFLKENLTQAEVAINLTYKDKTYQFKATETKEDDISRFVLALYPFCKEFEEAGLSDQDLMSSTFSDTASSEGMDYSGSFTMKALKG